MVRPAAESAMSCSSRRSRVLRLVDRLGPRDARPPRALLVEADEQLGPGVVMRLEPRAEVPGVANKVGFIAGERLPPAMEPEMLDRPGGYRGSAVTVNGGVLVAKSGLTTR
jgi:hypothetical protein